MQLGFWTLLRPSITWIVDRSREKEIWIPKVILILYNKGRTILLQRIRCCIYYNYFREIYPKASVFKAILVCCVFFFLALLFLYHCSSITCTRLKTPVQLVLTVKTVIKRKLAKANPWKERTCLRWRLTILNLSSKY